MTLGRPKPIIIMAHVDPKTHISYEVLQAKSYYSVLYKGQPINYRALNKLLSVQCVKYNKVSFANVGSAHKLARMLNKKFKTDGFEVFEMNPGEKVNAQPKKGDSHDD